MDDVIAVIEDDNIKYFYKDHLGSVVVITDASGSIVEQYAYDVFGEPYVKS